jgi:alpha-1,2-mannosyltransferase
MASTQARRPGQEQPAPPGRPRAARSAGQAPWLVGAVRLVAALGTLDLIVHLVRHALTRHGRWLLADLHVYRHGGQAVVHGLPLYSVVTNGKLLFTYPPVAALLAVPLTWVSWPHAQIAWMPVVLVPLAVVTGLAFRPLLARAGPYGPALFAGLLSAGLLLTPVRQEIHYGQVDMVLVALCAVDCLARRAWWPRGALIGLATAVKLVPGVFIVYLLITGRRKAAAVAAGTFAAATGLAWLIVPADSRAYWTSAIFNARRLGSNLQSDNQSLRGMLLRAVAPAALPTALWAGVALVVAVAGFAAARRAWRRGFAVGGVAITGLLAALLSPVAWLHHYCWIVVALGAIVGDGRRPGRVLAAVAAAGLYLTMLPALGGVLHARHLVPAATGLALTDAFGLGALTLIAALAWLRPGPADRLPAPPARPAVAAAGDQAGQAELAARATAGSHR